MARPGPSKSTSYTYTVLAAMEDSGNQQSINAYGVVTECSASKKTIRDHMCSVKITDPSMVNAESGTLSTTDLLVFASDKAQLPHVRNAGDIIRIHRARINQYKGRTQIIVSLSDKFRKGPPAAMCLFDGKPTPGSLFEDEPYQRSSKSFHFDDREKVILTALRDFVRSDKWSARDKAAEKYRKSIRDIVTDGSSESAAVFADLIGLVLAVEAEDGCDSKIVWMWDGTDSPPFPPTFSTNVNQGQQPGEETEETREANTLHHRPFPVSSLPPTAAAALPMIGTAVPVLVKSNEMELPTPGTWVKFRNCGFQIVQGQLQGVFSKKSRWIPWDEDDPVLQKYTHRLALKITSEWYNSERSVCASTTLHSDQQVTSLRQIAVDALQPDPQPATYRCIVRVLSHQPKADDANLMCLPARASWEAAQADGYTDPENQFMFALRLRVVDGTGTELDVDIFGADGAEFFKEIIAPQDLRENETARNTLQATLKYLTGNLEGPNSSTEPVWLDMCIKSYLLPQETREKEQHEEKGNSEEGEREDGGADEEDNGENGAATALQEGGKKKVSARYRVFDTKLLRRSN